MMKNILFVIPLLLLSMFFSCRGDDEIIQSTQTTVDSDAVISPTDTIRGFFLLNEGNMGSNQATLDYYDYTTGVYSLNIFPSRNTTVVHELGDVGNDIQIYGNKLYAVINCSNMIEVMDLHTAKHLAQIYIPNCRYITFNAGKAYVTSYAGPVQLNDPSYRLGYVAKIDTASYEVTDTCNVGYQPEQMVVTGGKLYVANSGGYTSDNYDRRVSVIDLATFKKTNDIDVAINLYCMALSKEGDIYVTSRGDYYNIPSRLFVIDPTKEVVTDTINIAVNGMCVSGDSIYTFGTAWNYTTSVNTISYDIVNTSTKELVSTQIIKDGTDSKITLPYLIAVNPQNKEIYISDAGDYVSPGKLYCFTSEGILKWSNSTGDIPGHIVFTKYELK